MQYYWLMEIARPSNSPAMFLAHIKNGLALTSDATAAFMFCSERTARVYLEDLKKRLPDLIDYTKIKIKKHKFTTSMRAEL